MKEWRHELEAPEEEHEPGLDDVYVPQVTPGKLAAWRSRFAGSFRRARQKPGKSLPRALAQRLEAETGQDLSDVRVHDSSEAAEAAHTVAAKAFTVGRDIFFGRGRYSPGTRGGDELLAHEVAHAAQAPKGARATKPTGIASASSMAERAAHSFAAAFSAGRSALGSMGLAQARPAMIYRDQDDGGGSLNDRIEEGFDHNAELSAINALYDEVWTALESLPVPVVEDRHGDVVKPQFVELLNDELNDAIQLAWDVEVINFSPDEAQLAQGVYREARTRILEVARQIQGITRAITEEPDLVEQLFFSSTGIRQEFEEALGSLVDVDPNSDNYQLSPLEWEPPEISRERGLLSEVEWTVEAAEQALFSGDPGESRRIAAEAQAKAAELRGLLAELEHKLAPRLEFIPLARSIDIELRSLRDQTRDSVDHEHRAMGPSDELSLSSQEFENTLAELWEGDPASARARLTEHQGQLSQLRPSLSEYSAGFDRSSKHAEVLASMSDPSAMTFGELAGAHTKEIMYGHQDAVHRTGIGTHTAAKHLYDDEGNEQPMPEGLTYTDCITYALEVMGKTFRDHGQGTAWASIKDRAYELSKKRKSGGLTGIDLQTALIELAGWKAVLIVADSDPKTAENEGFEHHLATLGMARRGIPLYGIRSRGVPGVKPVASITDYAPADDSRHEENVLGLEQLRALPFGFLTADDGGDHTAILAGGRAYEAHMSYAPTEASVFDSTPVDVWAYKSMLVAAPAADVDAALAKKLE